MDWEEVSFPVQAGEHTFTWTYEKDSSGSSGQGTAWIDDVYFPVDALARQAQRCAQHTLKKRVD